MGNDDESGSKCGFLCQYTTVRKVSVRDPKLALTYYGTILLVFIYVIVYTIVLEKGYQKFDTVVGSAAVKVKGTGSVCMDNVESDWTNPNCTVYDAIDLVYPSIELDALFIATSISQTADQTQSTCNGNGDVQACTNHTDCVENTFDPASQGTYNILCINTSHENKQQLLIAIRIRYQHTFDLSFVPKHNFQIKTTKQGFILELVVLTEDVKYLDGVHWKTTQK